MRNGSAMNKKRRLRLRDCVAQLRQATTKIGMILDEEQMSVDNIPENLSDSDKVQLMEENVDILEDVVEELYTIIDQLGEVV